MLNTVLLVGLGGAVVYLGAPVLAVAVALLGGLAIALRGYLVPGTPQLARRLPDWVHDRFGTADPAVSLPVTDALIEAGVLTTELELTPAAESEILDTARRLVEDRADLEAAVAEMVEGATEISVSRSLGGGEHWLALDADEVTLEQWPARPVVALDVAATSTLAARLPDWTGRSASERRHCRALVRYGTPRCPACEEAFTTPDGPDVACCGGRSLAGERRCPECGYPLVDRNDLPTAAASTDAAVDDPPLGVRGVES